MLVDSGRIDYIVSNPERATTEIISNCKRERKLDKQLQQKAIEEGLRSNGYHVANQKLRRTHQAVQIMDKIIINVGLRNSQRKLWEIQPDCLNKVYVNGSGNKKRAKTKVHPSVLPTCWPVVAVK